MTSYCAAWMVATMSPSSPARAAPSDSSSASDSTGPGGRPDAMASDTSRNIRSSISRIWLPEQRYSRRASRPSGSSGVAV